jgi:cell volume regulation protein A
MGRASIYLINRVRLGYEGLYPVLTLAMVLLTFGVAERIGGNGFLAVYLAGIMLGRSEFIHKKSLMRFHNGLAWLMQIAMFLTLGLLVFPSRLTAVIGIGLLVALFLMFVARPLGVFLCLIPTAFNRREKAFISWVGLRGAVPIILATYPLLAGLPQADFVFNVVFFVVLTSVLLQGTSLAQVARWLGLDAPLEVKRLYPIEYVPMEGLKSELKELPLPTGSPADGKAIFEIGLPDDFLVILIARQDDFLVPSGGTVLHAGDTLLVLSPEESFTAIKKKVQG